MHRKSTRVGKQVKDLDPGRPLPAQLPGVPMIKEEPRLQTVVEAALEGCIALPDEERIVIDPSVHDTTRCAAGLSCDGLHNDRRRRPSLDASRHPFVDHIERHFRARGNHDVVSIPVDHQARGRTVAETIDAPKSIERIERRADVLPALLGAAKTCPRAEQRFSEILAGARVLHVTGDRTLRRARSRLVVTTGVRKAKTTTSSRAAVPDRPANHQIFGDATSVVE